MTYYFLQEVHCFFWIEWRRWQDWTAARDDCLSTLFSLISYFCQGCATRSLWAVCGLGWPMNASQHKITNLLKIFFFAHQFLLVFVYLMCGPRLSSSSSVAQRRQKVGHPVYIVYFIVYIFLSFKNIDSMTTYYKISFEVLHKKNKCVLIELLKRKLCKKKYIHHLLK